MNIETGKFLSIVFNVEYDATNKTNTLDTYLKIDVSALRSGLLHHVRGSELTVLLAIASFMDKDGECYPTQRQIAEITGLSLTTVNKSISNLLEIKINDRPILERTLRGSGQRKNSIYTIFDIAPQDAPVEDNRDIDSIIVDAPIEEAMIQHIDVIHETNQDNTYLIDAVADVIKPKTEIKNAKDVAHYFGDKYKEQYGKAYVINYKRDLGLIKNKLIKNFDIEDIILIIDTCIEEYPSKWKNSKYPYPTIGMLCSWLCNEVVKLLLVKDEKDQKTQELIEATADYIEADYSDFNDL